jgi:hypothetical protein
MLERRDDHIRDARFQTGVPWPIVNSGLVINWQNKKGGP